MKIKLLFICLLFLIKIQSQTYSVNFNVDVKNKDVKSIVDLWQNYLKTNSKSDWDNNEVKDLKNFNILDMEGVINPSLMNWHFNNRILSINPISENKYLIKSIFETDSRDVFAITNVLAKKIGNEFKLSNYIFDYTKNWNNKKSENIEYFYSSPYELNSKEVDNAENFYGDLCKFFNVIPEKLTYFITKNCDQIYDVLGYEYIFSKGQGEECGYYESKNNYIFSTQKGGANHYHEITHFINKFFPDANYLLLTGISAYISKNKAHLGKPLIYHLKRVNDYLEKHPEIDLSSPFSFNQLDEKTNPQYVIGAILCDLILKKGGKKELILAFNSTKTDENLLDFLKINILEKNQNLNFVLRDRILII
jgi:hypothetical protein